jgi:hypothetical protein
LNHGCQEKGQEEGWKEEGREEEVGLSTTKGEIGESRFPLLSLTPEAGRPKPEISSEPGDPASALPASGSSYAATISPVDSSSGAGPHTYSTSFGVCSARLPREMTMPTGSCSFSALRFFAMVVSVQRVRLLLDEC